MSPEQIESLWSRFTASLDPRDPQAPELEQTELKQLEMLLDAAPKTLRELADERIVDAILKFAARDKKQDAAFVHSTVERIKASQSATQQASHNASLSGEPLSQQKSVQLSPAKNSGSNSKLPTITPAAASTEEGNSQIDLESDVVLVGNTAQKDGNTIVVRSRGAQAGSSRKKRRSVAGMVAAILAVAAAFAFIVGAAVYLTRPPASEIVENDNVDQPRQNNPDQSQLVDNSNGQVADVSDPEQEEPDAPFEINDGQREQRQANRDDPVPGTRNAIVDSLAQPVETDRLENDALENAVEKDDVETAIVDNGNSDAMIGDPDNEQVVETGPDGAAIAGNQVVGPLFASIVDLGDLNSGDESHIGRVGERLVEFTTGTGLVNFDNGTGVYFEAPASFAVTGENSIELLDGNFETVIPKEAGGFEARAGGFVWKNDGRADFQIGFQPNGNVEGLVYKGRVLADPVGTQELATDEDQLREPDAGNRRNQRNEDSIALNSNGLNQIVINPEIVNDLPLVAMATDGRKFLGQIGCGTAMWRTDSPLEFDRATAALDQKRIFTPDGLAARWEQMIAAGDQTDIVNQIEQMADVGENGIDFPVNNGNGADTFDGTLIINGVEYKFDNEDDFNRAQQELNRQMGVPPERRGASGGAGGIINNGGAGGINRFGGGSLRNGQDEMSQSESNSMFDGEININGRSMRFNSPEEFKDFRQRMKRLNR